MPDSKYFAKLGGAFFLGVFALIIAFIVFVFLLPYIIPLALGVFVIIVIFLVLWAIVYVAMVVGVGIYYFVRHPTEWEKEDKGYSIKKTKEAGRRQKGKSRKNR